MSGPLGDLRPADDGSVADWVFDSLHPFDAFDVGSVIPSGFDAYGCLLHSARSDDDQVHGSPALEDVRTLAGVLSKATSRPDRCWFCIWSGWGWLHVSAGSIVALGGERPGWRDPLVDVEQLASSSALVGNQFREYHLFSGPVGAVVDSSLPRHPYQAPSIWWPDDRSWIVASEIDLSWTYVAGAAPLIEQVIGGWRFDGKRVKPDDPHYWNEIQELKQN
jgi:hypothetical protein